MLSRCEGGIKTKAQPLFWGVAFREMTNALELSAKEIEIKYVQYIVSRSLFKVSFVQLFSLS